MQCSRCCEASRNRHVNIKHHGIGRIAVCGGQRIQAIASHLHAVPRCSQAGSHRLTRVKLIVDDEKALGMLRCHGLLHIYQLDQIRPIKSNTNTTINTSPKPPLGP